MDWEILEEKKCRWSYDHSINIRLKSEEPNPPKDQHGMLMFGKTSYNT